MSCSNTKLKVDGKCREIPNDIEKLYVDSDSKVIGGMYKNGTKFKVSANGKIIISGI